jgi:hypothetical protein
MSSIQSTLENIALALTQQITEVVNTVAPRHKVADPAALIQDILVGLGLADLKIDIAAAAKPKPKKPTKPRTKKIVDVPAPAAPAAPAPPAGEEVRELIAEIDTVLAGGAAAAAAVADAADADAAADAEEKPKPKKPAAAEGEEKPKKAPKAPKAPKEKTGRWTWTPTSTKLYKAIAAEVGVEVTAENKADFVTHINAMTDDVYATLAPQGHMRQFFTDKKVPAPAPAPAPPALEPLESVD